MVITPGSEPPLVPEGWVELDQGVEIVLRASKGAKESGDELEHVKDRLRKWLSAGAIPCQVIEDSGVSWEAPAHIFLSTNAWRVFETGRASFDCAYDDDDVEGPSLPTSLRHRPPLELL